MNYEQLKHHASSCEMAADEMAIKYIRLESFIKVQSICDFNIFYAYDLSPEVFIRAHTINFLSQNVRTFKRKIKLPEMSYYDAVINRNEITTFKEFKKHVTQHSK